MMTQANLHDLVSNRAGLSRTTTLFREPGLRTFLLHLKAGERMPEHQTRGAITIHCVGGKGTFSAAQDEVELRSGVLISVPPALLHSVKIGRASCRERV